jgi:hypothetical protein
MTDSRSTAVPVWTLTTDDLAVLPDIINGEVMTSGRLTELRSVLAALAESPIATLEAHPLPKELDRTRGIPLDSASPLARHLSQLITQTPASAPGITAGGEALYRMVVPAKVAAQFGKGLVRSMTSKAAGGGIHSALVNSSGIAAQASFVPVAGNAAKAAGAAGAVGAAGALTFAAPLVLMAVAAGLSAHADYQQKQATEHITELLEKLHEHRLADERNALNGCRDAIEAATAVLLDRGQVGDALGLGPAVYAIDKALAAARERLTGWQNKLAKFGDRPVEIDPLRKAFPGVLQVGGEFHAYVELARLAIALKQRVLVLQAVDQAQREGPDHPFESFMRTLRASKQRVDEMESGITAVLRELSALKLTRTHGLRDFMFSPGEIDDLLRAIYTLRTMGDAIEIDSTQPDVAIEIARESNGSLFVLPAITA